MINLYLLTGAALMNGLNPCGIGMMITFLGYLMVFSGREKDKGWLYKTGVVYILSVFLTYLALGLFFYGIAYYLQRWWLASLFKYLVGGGIFVAGLVQIKDVFWQDLPFHLQMPTFGFEKINKLMAKTSLGVTALVGILTTVFSSPCMLPIYLGTTSVMARSGLPMFNILAYFLYYNLIFITPLMVILLIMTEGKRVVEMKEWQHKNTGWLRFVLGVVLLFVGYLIMFR